MKHTPGPWKISDGLTTGDHLAIDIGLDGLVLVERHAEGNDEADLSNAHLIAAAPSLLAALEHAKNVFRPFTTKPIGSPNSPARRRQDAEISAYNHICAAIMTIGHKQEDDDQTPYCSWCKARYAKNCKCGPTAKND